MTTASTRSFAGWRMVVLAFLSYNVGLTVVINAFGPALPVIQRELGLSRAQASLPFGMLMLALGLLAPFVGNLTRVVRLRTLMMAGAALHAAGFALLAFATSLAQVLLLFAVFIGSGACLMAVISAPALIGRWFVRDRGKALGLGLVQVLGVIAAPAAAWAVGAGGRHLLFLGLAVLFVLMIPLLALVIDHPEDIGQTPRLPLEAQATTAPPASLLTNREIFADPAFWLISVAVGVASAAGTTFTAHGPAMAVAHGLGLELASTMLSGCGLGALLGAFAYGWAIDRIGPFRALFLTLVQAAATWFLFSLASSAAMLILLSVLLGAAMGPAVTMHSACISERYGAASFARVIGYSYFTKIPFLFGAAPLAGKLYDLSHSYASTYAALIGALLAAAVAALVLSFGQKRAVAAAATA